jgi:hypothetical protein
VKNPIFIVGLGRCGSTMLWNLFRQIPECTAYSEPLSPELESQLEHPHYIHEVPKIAHHYFVNTTTDEFVNFRPFKELKEHRRFHDDPLDEIFDYFDLLIDNTPNTTVIKEVRLNGTLDKVKAQYPDSYMIHLWRSLKPQKQSVMLRGIHKFFEMYEDVGGELQEYTFEELYQKTFEEGQRVADISVKYDDILTNPLRELYKILKPVGWQDYITDLIPWIKR